MNSGSNYRICSGAPFGEDYSCSDGIKHDIFKTNVYMDEHRFYFGHKVRSVKEICTWQLFNFLQATENIICQ